MATKAIPDSFPNCLSTEERSRILALMRAKPTIKRILLDPDSYCVFSSGVGRSKRGRLKHEEYLQLQKEFRKVCWPKPSHINVHDRVAWIKPAFEDEEKARHE